MHALNLNRRLFSAFLKITDSQCQALIKLNFRAPVVEKFFRSRNIRLPPAGVIGWEWTLDDAGGVFWEREWEVGISMGGGNEIAILSM
jgi:hypothetical protein